MIAELVTIDMNTRGLPSVLRCSANLRRQCASGAVVPRATTKTSAIGRRCSRPMRSRFSIAA
jgi:hypothetical protein